MRYYDITENTIYLSGAFVKSTIHEFYQSIHDDLVLLNRYFNEIFIDGAGITELDNAGVALIDELSEKYKIKDTSLINFSDANKEKMRILCTKGLKEEAMPTKDSYLYLIGDYIFSILMRYYDMLVLTSDVFYWSIVDIWQTKGHRKGSFTNQCLQIGFNALPIVGLLSFIVGIILALQSAVQMKNFGADQFLPHLLAHSFVRELSPLITAVIVAGRSGSAIASEIATMKVTEEIDALKMMALNPIRYVVVPKFHALTVSMALLVTFSIIVGMLGGVIIAVFYLGQSASSFISTCFDTIATQTFVISLLKSTVFAWQIVIIGSYYGFSAVGGSEGVGKVTTQAVVSSIFGVIIMDAIFSFQYLV